MKKSRRPFRSKAARPRAFSHLSSIGGYHDGTRCENWCEQETRVRQQIKLVNINSVYEAIDELTKKK